MDATRIQPHTDKIGADNHTLTGTPERHPRLNQRLKDRYRIEALIASGGMSDVYRAVDENLERAGSNDCQVAVKILRQALTHDPDAVSMLAREAARSMRLAHPNIIRVKDLEQDGETWFIVMELLEGEPLSRLIQRHRPRGLPWKGCRWIIRQVQDALRYSHDQGIVHADLKPSNVFLTRDGQVKLLDFGVARALKPQRQMEDYLAPRQQDETRMFGYTPAYASPSLMAGNEPTARDDLYALACITYELVSTRHPFDRRELTDAERADYPLKRPRHLPRRVWRVIRPLLRQSNPDSSMATWARAVSPPRWRVPVAAATGGLLASLTLAGAQAGLGMGADKNLSFEDRLEDLGLLSDETGARQVLTTLPALPELARHAVLRQREPMLSHYYTRAIEQGTQALQEGELERIPETLDTVAKAEQHYPNHATITEYREQFLQRRASLVNALQDQWRQQLARGDFMAGDTLQSLTDLHDRLALLAAEIPEPGPDIRGNYRAALERTMAQHDTSGLANLVAMGDRVFRKDQNLAALLAWARVQAGLLPGKTAPEAATRAPEQQLKRLEEAIAEAGSVAELDAVFKQVQALSGDTENTAGLRELRQSLANRYMQQARERLDERRLESAGPLLERATNLARQAQASP
ncbi:serine/threonine-protein kinase [uncultured Halovibrio sp.]|uniref:serine/threonine-protein kinase n=1 Tax=uncultured Halovibrio sp. TaxID=985049 RepID=UPI0025E9CEF6|nr:serine/threonine-protein kinase [uncultured Halovibrio sp.]